MGERDVLRLHIRSTIRGDEAHDQATTWCLQNGYAGLGWGIWAHKGLSGISWPEYEQHGRADSNVRRFHDAPIGTLLWTRERKGDCWLGVIEGDWEYRDDDLARELDLFNLRPTRWERIGTEGACRAGWSTPFGHAGRCSAFTTTAPASTRAGCTPSASRAARLRSRPPWEGHRST